MLIEWGSSDATVTNGRIINVPHIIGRISRDMGRKLIEDNHGLLIQRAEIRHISLVERLSIFGQDHISVIRYRSSGDARAIAPEEFLFLFGGAISEFLVSAAFDTQFTVGIAFEALGFVVAIGNIRSLIILLHPGIEMLDIEGNNLAETGYLFL